MGKTIGILGGMGPEATIYFFDLIVRNTSAIRDQDHIPVIIHSDPRVPPRTEAILKGGESPVRLLRLGAKNLERAGADFIVMPCITAHYFLDEIRSAVTVPFVDLVHEAVSFAAKYYSGLERAGLLGSSGTVESRLVHDAFARQGVVVMDPTPEEQALVNEAIFGEQGIKAGFCGQAQTTSLFETAEALIRRGAQAIIAGCTEVPLALRKDDLGVPFIEPMEIGALVSIRRAGYAIRGELPE